MYILQQHRQGLNSRVKCRHGNDVTYVTMPHVAYAVLAPWYLQGYHHNGHCSIVGELAIIWCPSRVLLLDLVAGRYSTGSMHHTTPVHNMQV